jgi:hypothetical protein
MVEQHALLVEAKMLDDREIHERHRWDVAVWCAHSDEVGRGFRAKAATHSN